MSFEIDLKLKNTGKHCELRTMFIEAIRGSYVSQLESSHGMNELERLMQKAMDDFATFYFERGREYERQQLK